MVDKGAMPELFKLYAPVRVSTNRNVELADDDTPMPPDLLDELMAMIKDTWKGKRIPYTVNAEAAAKIADYLFEGIITGWSESGAEAPVLPVGVPTNRTAIDYTTPDTATLDALRQHTFQFSAAKNYTELRAMAALLSQPNGKLREWGEFKQLALELHTTMNVHWLKSEYNFAIASGQMAGKWQTVQKDKGTLPLLQFDAIMDQRTSGLCRSLEGVIKPVDDAFWNQYYPPNHWGCRSTVRQLCSGVETPMSQITYPEVHEMFKVNLGQQRFAFPPSHPYFINNPTEVATSAKQLYGK